MHGNQCGHERRRGGNWVGTAGARLTAPDTVSAICNKKSPLPGGGSADENGGDTANGREEASKVAVDDMATLERRRGQTAASCSRSDS